MYANKNLLYTAMTRAKEKCVILTPSAEVVKKYIDTKIEMNDSLFAKRIVHTIKNRTSGKTEIVDDILDQIETN